MTDQLQMIWPEDGVAERPEWRVPAGYRSRGYREGDAEAYIDLMRMSGFDRWGRHDLNNVLEYAVPNGIIFV